MQLATGKGKDWYSIARAPQFQKEGPFPIKPNPNSITILVFLPWTNVLAESMPQKAAVVRLQIHSP